MIRRVRPDELEGSLRDLAPDLTPMLDILFILLVFFMLTAGIALQSFDLELPKSIQTLGAAGNQNQLLLEIDRTGYRLDGAAVKDFEMLKKRLAQKLKQNPNYKLTIASDKRAQIERLLELLIHLQTTGVEAASILMKKK